MRVYFSSFLQDLDKKLAIIGLFISISITLYGGISGKIIAILIGVLLLISCIFWLIIRQKTLLNDNIPRSQSKMSIWACCFFLFYIASMLIVYFRDDLYVRPLFYFILTSLMAGAIACEILTENKKHSLFILIQIILLGMSLTWTQQLITPGLVGIDPWYHMFFTNIIMAKGFLPPGHGYSTEPFFHLMIVGTSFITNLSYKFSTLISVSFGQIICNTVFLFLISKYIFNNYRIGLLAALSVVIAPYHILMSYWSIPNSFAPIFIIIILYLLLLKNPNKFSNKYLLLTIILMLAIIFTHPLVSMCMALILFSIWGTLNIYKLLFMRCIKSIQFFLPVWFTFMMIVWWIYISNTFESIIKFLKFDDSFAGSVSVQNAIQINSPMMEQITCMGGHYIIFTLGFIGFFYMTSKKGNSASFSLAFISTMPLILVFISYFGQIQVYAYRWLYISQILFCILFACSIYLIGTYNFRNLNYLYCFYFFIFVILSFLIFVGPDGSNDYVAFTETSGQTRFFTQSELTGSAFFAHYFDGILSTDNFFGANTLHYANNVPINSYNNNLQSNIYDGKFDHDGSAKIFRKRYLSELQSKKLISLNLYQYLLKDVFIMDFSKIYDSKAIIGYIG